MRTVMLIDDDYLSLLKLEKMLPWEKYSFKHVYSATDPNVAIKQLSILNPDVVFTDICMCNTSGFDIIDFAKNNNLKSLFVIISGHDSFEYAQKAIRMNVVDYMLKPITPEECDHIFSVLKNILDDKNISDLSSYVPTSKYQIKNSDFRSLIEYINDNISESLSLMALSKKFNLNLSYCCQLFQKYFSCSFSEYVIAIKLQKASELIAQTDMKTSEIAGFLNYDYAHFCKTFKKHFGITPHIYRKLVNAKEEDIDETEEQ